MKTAASADLIRLLAGFVEEPGAQHWDWAAALDLAPPTSLEAWQAAHTETFLNQCAPHASVYLDARGAIGGEASDRVAGFRRLLGARVDGPPDALGALLGDYAALAERANRDSQAAHARRALLWEHLLCWLIPYLDSVARSADEPYTGWAELTREVFLAEAGLAGLPERLPLHLRTAPKAGFKSDECGLEDLIKTLLTPIRSGIILTRRDLTHVAETLGVAAGFASRRFILRNLLEARPEASLHRLADEAGRQAGAYADNRAALGPVADFWALRAAGTRDSLTAMTAQWNARAVTIPRTSTGP
jgi:TorA maturation chaperone TorD